MGIAYRTVYQETAYFLNENNQDAEEYYVMVSFV